MNNQAGKDDQEYFIIKVVRKPWYRWMLWGLWLFLEVIFFQSAIASGKEFEPRAAIVFWLLFVVFLIGGITVLIIRRLKLL